MPVKYDRTFIIEDFDLEDEECSLDLEVEVEIFVDSQTGEISDSKIISIIDRNSGEDYTDKLSENEEFISTLNDLINQEEFDVDDNYSE